MDSTALTELDKFYQPSHWSRRFSSPEEVLTHHLHFIENASEKTRRHLPCHLNLLYGPSEREKIDIFGTDLSDDSPLFVFIHGGYWQESALRRDSYHFIAKNLHRNGIKVAFVGYQLCPDATLDRIVQQVKQAAQKCLAYAQDKGSKGVFFAGHSAGAHLVASVLSTDVDTIVKGAILISGVFDLAPLLKTVINGPMGMDEEVALEMSPLKQKFEGNGEVEFRVVVGGNESPEFIKQSREFYEKLKNSEFKACFSLVENVDHFDIIEKLDEKDFELTRCIIDLIKSQ